MGLYASPDCYPYLLPVSSDTLYWNRTIELAELTRSTRVLCERKFPISLFQNQERAVARPCSFRPEIEQRENWEIEGVFPD
jgi:hypothetical protein